MGGCLDWLRASLRSRCSWAATLPGSLSPARTGVSAREQQQPPRRDCHSPLRSRRAAGDRLPRDRFHDWATYRKRVVAKAARLRNG